MIGLAWRRPVLTRAPATPVDLVASLVTDALATDGVIRWRARGRSMQPAIRHDEVVELRPVDQVEVGDVVLAHVRAAEQLVLHRVRSIDGEHLTLRGDARRANDPAVTCADVLAVVEPRPKRSAASLLWRALA